MQFFFTLYYRIDTAPFDFLLDDGYSSFSHSFGGWIQLLLTFYWRMDTVFSFSLRELIQLLFTFSSRMDTAPFHFLLEYGYSSFSLSLREWIQFLFTFSKRMDTVPFHFL